MLFKEKKTKKNHIYVVQVMETCIYGNMCSCKCVYASKQACVYSTCVYAYNATCIYANMQNVYMWRVYANMQHMSMKTCVYATCIHVSMQLVTRVSAICVYATCNMHLCNLQHESMQHAYMQHVRKHASHATCVWPKHASHATCVWSKHAFKPVCKHVHPVQPLCWFRTAEKNKLLQTKRTLYWRHNSLNDCIGVYRPIVVQAPRIKQLDYKNNFMQYIIMTYLVT